ncbi:MAG: methyltransferase, partial [Desulfobacterium sp.]|nr:methyltransferase [Desulfobacterium sp.]MBU4036010.1 methyltransferase [Pseudomonadota bacterium]
MELIERNHCVISGNEDLELLYSFKDFPVFMGCVDQPPEEDLKTDMNWWISKSTGSIQLNPLLPLDILYQEQHAGSVG